MSDPADIARLRLTEFLDAIAARTPVPGGGTAACVAASLGAALGTMAARFAKHESAATVAQRLEELSRDLLLLGQRDMAAYDAVTPARALPKGTDAEKSHRRSAIQGALVVAAQAPLDAMARANDALGLLAEFAPHANPNLASDLGCAALLLWAGLEGSSMNVAINVAGLADEKTAADLRDLSSRIQDEARKRRDRIFAALAPDLRPR